MQRGAERLSFSVRGDDAQAVVGQAVNSARQRHPKMARHQRRRAPCDKASPATAVMLHLRSCYVSKAAILTVPVHPVPVENRSPA